MSTQIISQAEAIVEMIDRMPADSVLIQHGVSWNDYEELLDAVGEASGLRICYDEGTLQVMSPSSKHEHVAKLIERLVDLLSIRQRIKVLFYGSATLKKQSEQKGAEPDACFYVQTADVVGKKGGINLNVNPPPDVVVENHLHQESIINTQTNPPPRFLPLLRYQGGSTNINYPPDGKKILYLRPPSPSLYPRAGRPKKSPPLPQKKKKKKFFVFLKRGRGKK